MADQQHFTTIEGAVDYFKALGFKDMGMVNGTRTMIKHGPSQCAASASYVAIWQPSPAQVTAERY